jgi:hypothetical protein
MQEIGLKDDDGLLPGVATFNFDVFKTDDSRTSISEPILSLQALFEIKL